MIRNLVTLIFVVCIVGVFSFLDSYQLGAKPELPLYEKISLAEPAERINLKKKEIVKIKTTGKERISFSNAEYDIEIVDIKEIENGVEVFAKAWNIDGSQIGFGKDGTVEIERFVIINPPILVYDNQGDIVRRTSTLDGETYTRNLKQDAKKAILETLVHTISVKEQKYNSSKIELGKIGNTTTTIYPSVDGTVGRFNLSEAWATIQGSLTGTDAVYTGADPLNFVSLRVSLTSSSEWRNLGRGGFCFDTSSIPDDDTIDSATFSLYPITVNRNIASQSYALVGVSLASCSSLATGDYDAFGTTLWSSAIAQADVGTGAYEDWALNATGLSNINKTGNTQIGMRISADYSNSEPGGEGTGDESKISASHSEHTGTSQDPKIVIEHSSATPDEEVSNSFIQGIGI